MTPVLVDSNVILDVVTDDPEWGAWSAATLEEVANEALLVINPLIYAELSVGFVSVEALEEAIPPELYRRDDLPYEAAFLAGRVFTDYRRRGGTRRSPLPDFYIGAHAAVAGFQLLTRCHPVPHIFPRPATDCAGALIRPASWPQRMQ